MEAEDTRPKDAYLNGWTRDGGTVFIGSATHCACCGKYQGTVCVYYDEDYVLPTKMPDWPFRQQDCPLCQLIHSGYQFAHKDPLAERMKLRERLEAAEKENRRLQKQIDYLTIPRA